MTRVLSYNILVGGKHRVEQLTKIIASAKPDIVGLSEATDAQVVETLAERLGMQFCITGPGKTNRDWHLAILSRFPIVETQIHAYPDIITRRYLLEVSVEEPTGQQLTAFVIHQTASFQLGSESNRIRRREIEQILQLMASKQGTQHILMGDFNSVVAGEPVKGSRLLRYILEEREKYYKYSTAVSPQYSHYSTALTVRRALVRGAARAILRSRLLSELVDRFSPIYAQGGINQLQKVGYVDCFRQVNPQMEGFTCPAANPAGRIDFIFASPELAQRLLNSDVVTEGDGICAKQASDHFAIYAEFGEYFQ